MAYQAFDLTGKTAIVTGGNSGIGLGMAEAMAQAGAAVCIWGTNEDKNVHALARLHATGAKALALRCDDSFGLLDGTIWRCGPAIGRRGRCHGGGRSGPRVLAHREIAPCARGGHARHSQYTHGQSVRKHDGFSLKLSIRSRKRRAHGRHHMTFVTRCK